ncbi:MAG: heavy-metal-associated domain-containing protein [Acidobacteriota bacterium]|nr:heavy-metal-associated domain-containing protein [Acidobacteriota bacterium]
MSTQSTSVVTKSFSVTGMTCGNCEKHVRHAAEQVPGVSAVSVDRPGNRATVSFDPGVTTPAAIAAAITDAGYETTEAGA